jgi:lipid A oxidase
MRGDLGTNGMKFRSILLTTASLVAVSLASTAARAEIVISAFGGIQGAFDSNVSGTDIAPGGVGPFNFDQSWNGDSFKNPLYWGVRTTLWLPQKTAWGVSLEYNHAKVYADPLPAGWERLEFTDGLNIFTINGMYRWQQPDRAWTPYVGAGVGISMPHVEVQTSPTAPQTFQYEVAGAAFQWQAGVDYKINNWFSVFGEYKGNYTMNDADLIGGGKISTDLFTNSLNFGVSFHWN